MRKGSRAKIQLLQFEQQRDMKQALSENVLNPNSSQLDLHELPSVPPGCQKLALMGLLTLTLQVNYLNKTENNLIFKVKLWGSTEQYLTFRNVSVKEAVLHLNIRSSLQKLSRYFSDMGVFCIECLASSREQSSLKEMRSLGWIFLNLKRYVVNFVLNGFEETVSISDHRKNKIGEVQANLNIEMYKKQKLFANATLPQITNSKNIAINSNSLNRPSHDYEPISLEIKHQKKQEMLKKNLIDKEQYKRNTIDDILSRQEFNRPPQEEWRRQFHPKGKAQQFLEQYQRSKPDHTQISLIRQKYGYNHPSIEVMKLKLDEATLLSRQQASNNGKQINRNIHLLLKNLKNESKSKCESLLIVCQQNQSPIKTQTKINMADQLGSKIEINYLYIIPNTAFNDKLSFEIKEGKAEATISELKQQKFIELKGKNGRKMAILQYSIISENFIASNQKKQAEVKAKEKEKQQVEPVKQSCFIKVEGWQSQKVQLSNKKIGDVYGAKLIFEAERPEDFILQIDLIGQEGQKYALKHNINHLYKEQNYILKDKQVKIISAKGKVTDLLTLTSKVEKTQTIPQNERLNQSKIEVEIDLKELSIIFENLQKCQNQQCNELMQSLSRELSSKKLDSLSHFICVKVEKLEMIIKQVYHNKFGQFFKAFLTYHSWNHRYQTNIKKLQKIIINDYESDFKKVVRKLKRSSEVLFGTISSTFFVHQFLKLDNDRPITETSQSNGNREDIAKLILLLLERYPIKNIKISQLERFLAGQDILNLNSYLLSKIAHEIVNNTEIFSQLVTEDDWLLINIFRTETEADWGLAKLLLATHDQMASSSVISQDNQQRRLTETERVQTNMEEYPPGMIRTQNNDQPDVKEDNQEKPIKKSKIAIVINSILISQQRLQDISLVEIASENQKITITRSNLLLPKAISLTDQNTFTVCIMSSKALYEGVFIAASRPQKIILYNNGEQAGQMLLFSQLENPLDQEEQIAIRIKNFEANRVAERVERSKQREQLEVQSITPVAQSPFVKLLIRSIRPTRPNFSLYISSSFETKKINFPNQNEILLKNAREWRLEIIDQQLDDIVVPNQLISSPYCFVDTQDKRVMITAMIQIQECWDAEVAFGLNQSIHLSIHFDSLLSVKQLEKGTYSICLESLENIGNISFECGADGQRVGIHQSISLQKPLEKLSAKLFKKTQKELIGEFDFTLKLIDHGIRKGSRYLLSKTKGLRLNITIYQIRHHWEHCKPDRIVSLFRSENRRVISSWINSIGQASQERLIGWLRANFQLTLGEIDIILQELVKEEDKNAISTFLSLFRPISKISVPLFEEIKDQFNVFDYNDQGTVSLDQLKIAKKVFTRNFKEFNSILMKKQEQYYPSPEVKENFIIDLSSAIKSNCFDYLSFLDLFQDQKQKKSISSKGVDQNVRQEKGMANLSIKLLQYENLSINKLPCTFLFKINDQILAQPIHKCYSYKYPIPNQVIVPSKPHPSLQICLQTLRSNGLWDSKLLETVPIQPKIRLFGGFIYLLVEPTDQAKPHSQQYNENRVVNGEQQSSESGGRKDFAKSFWNKSLNETKQRWAELKKSRHTGKQ